MTAFDKYLHAVIVRATHEAREDESATIEASLIRPNETARSRDTAVPRSYPAHARARAGRSVGG